jgi:hypothetical protein
MAGAISDTRPSAETPRLRTLGLTIALGILLAATEVIE